MRLGCISDVHGNLPALEAVLEDGQSRGVHQWINLGDLVSGPLWPAETAARLMRLDLPTIQGNHERQLTNLAPGAMNASDLFAYRTLSAEQRQWLASFPSTREFDGGLFACHGTPESDLGYLLEALSGTEPGPAAPASVEAHLTGVSAHWVVCGHTHVQRELQLASGKRVINPGSVGLPAYESDQPVPHKMTSGVPHARYGILNFPGGKGESVELLRVEYEWERAARKAEREGRSDWAFSLRTGQA